MVCTSPLNGRHLPRSWDQNVPPNRSHRPEIGEDLAFEHHSWRVQRIGWALLAVVIAAGLAGLMGSGPLSNVTARDGKSLEVEYERFVRHGAQTEIRVRMDQSRASQARVVITREFLDTSHLQRTLPEPARVQASGANAIFYFDVDANHPLQATFVMEPVELGAHEARIAIDDGSSVSVRQFTYP